VQVAVEARWKGVAMTAGHRRQDCSAAGFGWAVFALECGDVAVLRWLSITHTWGRAVTGRRGRLSARTIFGGRALQSIREVDRLEPEDLVARMDASYSGRGFVAGGVERKVRRCAFGLRRKFSERQQNCTKVESENYSRRSRRRPWQFRGSADVECF
jgi:hypothetical protein